MSSQQPPPRPERAIAFSFAVSAVGGVAFIAAAWLDWGLAIIGVTLAVAFAGLGVGFVMWAARLTAQGKFVEEHEPFASSRSERRTFADEYERDTGAIGRRGMLGRTLAAALGVLGLGALLPIRSLGPNPGNALKVTPWRRGSRVTTEDGEPVRPEDLQEGTVLTVFPDGISVLGDTAALLVRVNPATLRLPEERMDWTVDGLVCYSKLCTHAGCPVGLYNAATEQLFCPCHQSIFDVLDGARPTAGPATRPLPQLPLELGENGELRAGGDFSDPVGPGFWELPS